MVAQRDNGADIFQADASRSLTKHRKIASSFRDTQLFEIYQLACSLLQTAEGNIKNLNFSDDNQVNILAAVSGSHIRIRINMPLCCHF